MGPGRRAAGSLTDRQGSGAARVSPPSESPGVGTTGVASRAGNPSSAAQHSGYQCPEVPADGVWVRLFDSSNSGSCRMMPHRRMSASPGSSPTPHENSPRCAPEPQPSSRLPGMRRQRIDSSSGGSLLPARSQPGISAGVTGAQTPVSEPSEVSVRTRAADARSKSQLAGLWQRQVSIRAGLAREDLISGDN